MLSSARATDPAARGWSHGVRSSNVVRFDAAGTALCERSAYLDGLTPSAIRTNNAGDVVVIATGGCLHDRSWVGILDAGGIWLRGGPIEAVEQPDPSATWAGHSGVNIIDAHLRDETLDLVGVQDAAFSWVTRFDLARFD